MANVKIEVAVHISYTAYGDKDPVVLPSWSRVEMTVPVERVMQLKSIQPTVSTAISCVVDDWLTHWDDGMEEMKRQADDVMLKSKMTAMHEKTMSPKYEQMLAAGLIRDDDEFGSWWVDADRFVWMNINRPWPNEVILRMRPYLKRVALVTCDDDWKDFLTRHMKEDKI